MRVRSDRREHGRVRRLRGGRRDGGRTARQERPRLPLQPPDRAAPSLRAMAAEPSCSTRWEYRVDNRAGLWPGVGLHPVFASSEARRIVVRPLPSLTRSADPAFPRPRVRATGRAGIHPRPRFDAPTGLSAKSDRAPHLAKLGHRNVVNCAASGLIGARACFAEVAGVAEVLAGGRIRGVLQAHHGSDPRATDVADAAEHPHVGRARARPGHARAAVPGT